jgi:hypothetical protein
VEKFLKGTGGVLTNSFQRSTPWRKSRKPSVGIMESVADPQYETLGLPTTEYFLLHLQVLERSPENGKGNGKVILVRAVEAFRVTRG